MAESVPAADYVSPRISPDGRRAAFGRRDGANTDIWVEDLATKALTRSTFDPGEDQHPVWSPDGAAMLYTSGAAGPLNLYRSSSGGNANPERVTTSPSQQQALDWSADGRFLLFSEVKAGLEIFILNTAGGERLSFLGQAKGAEARNSIRELHAGFPTILTTVAAGKCTCSHLLPGNRRQACVGRSRPKGGSRRAGGEMERNCSTWAWMGR